MGDIASICCSVKLLPSLIDNFTSGKCKRHFIQTPELLRLVHTHNQRGVVEDSLPGSLKSVQSYSSYNFVVSLPIV